MKLKNIFSLLLLSVVALFTSCSNDDDITLLDDIQVSKSYISIPEEGGNDTIIVKAKGDWILENKPNWLKINEHSDSVGKAGETQLVFLQNLTQAAAALTP